MNYIHAMIETSNYAKPYIVKGKCEIEQQIFNIVIYVIFDDCIMDVQTHLRDPMSLDSSQGSIY